MRKDRWILSEWKMATASMSVWNVFFSSFICISCASVMKFRWKWDKNMPVPMIGYDITTSFTGRKKCVCAISLMVINLKFSPVLSKSMYKFLMLLLLFFSLYLSPSLSLSHRISYSAKKKCYVNTCVQIFFFVTFFTLAHQKRRGRKKN